VAVFEDGRGDVGAGAAVPQDGLGAEIALAADLDGGAARGGKAAEDIDGVATGDEAGGDVAGEAVGGIPAQLAGVGIHAPQFLRHGDDEIVHAIALEDVRRAVGHAEVALGFPHDFAGRFVEAEDGLALVVGVHDEQVSIDDGAGCGTPAPLAGAGAAGGLPELLALEVKGQRAALAEEDVDALAIRHRRVGGVTVLGDEAGERILRSSAGHLGVPQHLAIGTAETEQMPHELAHVVRARFVAVTGPAGDEDALAEHDGAGGTRPGHVRFPEQVFRVAPLQRHLRFRDHGRPRGPEETRPVIASGGEKRGSGKSEREGGSEGAGEQFHAGRDNPERAGKLRGGCLGGLFQSMPRFLGFSNPTFQLDNGMFA